MKRMVVLFVVFLFIIAFSIIESTPVDATSHLVSNYYCDYESCGWGGRTCAEDEECYSPDPNGPGYCDSHICFGGDASGNTDPEEPSCTHDPECSGREEGVEFCNNGNVGVCTTGGDGCADYSETICSDGCEELTGEWGAGSRSSAGTCQESASALGSDLEGSSCTTIGSTRTFDKVEGCILDTCIQKFTQTECESTSLDCWWNSYDSVCEPETSGTTYTVGEQVVTYSQTCNGVGAQCTVAAEPTGSFTFTSSVCDVLEGSSTCTGTISWSTSDASDVRVFTGSGGLISSSTSGSANPSWVRPLEHNDAPNTLSLYADCTGTTISSCSTFLDSEDLYGLCESGTIWDASQNACVAGDCVSDSDCGFGEVCSSNYCVTTCSAAGGVGCTWSVGTGETERSAGNDYCGTSYECVSCNSGYSWDSGSNNCVADAYCGDGTKDFGEECDDGNTVSGDGCSSSCTLESCASHGGDGCTSSVGTGETEQSDGNLWCSVNAGSSYECVSCNSGYEWYSGNCRSCVEITGISVSDSEPLENTQIQLRCSASPSGHSNVVGSISGDGSCSFNQWSGSDAVFDCNVGSAGSKTLTCGVQNRCQIGSDMSTTISVQSSDCSTYGDSSSCAGSPASCDWCSGSSCSGNQYSSTAGSCVPSGSCDSYSCTIGQCSATCDNTGPNPSCVDEGYDGGPDPADCDTGYSGASCQPLTGVCYNTCDGSLPSGSFENSTNRIYGGSPSDSLAWYYVSDTPDTACEFTCEDPTPVYDSSTNSCVGCLSDSDCASGQACSGANTCEDVEVSLDVYADGAPVSEGETLTQCNNPSLRADCSVTPSGIGHDLGITSGCAGSGTSSDPWSCDDGDYTVTCTDSESYGASNSTSFRLDSPPATVSGTIRDENGSPVSGIEWTASLLKDGVEVDSLSESDGDYSLSAGASGEYVVTLTAEGFDLTSQSILIECGTPVTQELTLSTLSCSSDCTSGYGVCNYDCLGEGCSLDDLDDEASDLSDAGDEITAGELEDLLVERCSGANPGDRRAVPGYPGHYFVCCGSSGSDSVQEFGTVPATVDSDARHLVQFTKIVNYDGLPVKMNVFVKGE